MLNQIDFAVFQHRLYRFILIYKRCTLFDGLPNLDLFFDI